MNKGIPLATLVQTVEAQTRAKRDYVADTRHLSFAPNASKLLVADVGEFNLTPHTHRQIGEKLAIPAKFYDRLKEQHPDILADAVNKLFQREPEKRLIRTQRNGTDLARAYLSDRYRPIDNDIILGTALRVLQETDVELLVLSSQVTERKLYLKVVFPKVVGEVRVGDVVRSGLSISNSEIGLGSYAFEPFIERLACINGAVYTDYGQRRPHIGRAANGGDDEVTEFYRDDTLKAADDALLLKLRDTIRAFIEPGTFHNILGNLQLAAGQPLSGSIPKAVEEVTRSYGLSKDENDSVLQRLIEGADLSRWGLHNAITSVAGDIKDYDRSHELEVLGGRLITNDADWNGIINAASRN